MPDQLTAELAAISERLEQGDLRAFAIDDAPRLLDVAHAVLELTLDSEGDELYYASGLTVGDLRDAITKALLGEDSADDDAR